MMEYVSNVRFLISCQTSIRWGVTELDGAYSGWIIFTSVISLVASVVSIVVHACMIGRHLCILHLSALVYSSSTYSTLVVFLDDFNIKENSIVFCILYKAQLK